MSVAPGAMVDSLRPVPTGVLYSTLLIFHVVSGVMGFGTTALTGIQAARARRGPSAPSAAGVRRYFRPGVNWAGRALYGVPVFGFALVAASHDAWHAGDAFVVVGLALWLVAALVAEVVIWPAERRVQVIVHQRWGDPEFTPTLERDCKWLATAAIVLVFVFVAAVVVMVGKL